MRSGFGVLAGVLENTRGRRRHSLVVFGFLTFRVRLFARLRLAAMLRPVASSTSSATPAFGSSFALLARLLWRLGRRVRMRSRRVRLVFGRGLCRALLSFRLALRATLLCGAFAPPAFRSP
jgi:hypothetical protein